MNFPPTISFFAPGIPKGQPRPRAFIRGKRAAVYDPGTAEAWKGDIAIAWRDAGFPKPIEGCPYRVELSFRFPRPKHHYTGKGILKPSSPDWHTSKPDIDNATKAVLDALTHLQLWKDDDAVASLTVSKTYGSPTGCLIHITSLPPQKP